MEKIADSVLGIRTRDFRMEDADESTGIWRPQIMAKIWPKSIIYRFVKFYGTGPCSFLLCAPMMILKSSATRLGDLLDFGQLFKPFGNN